MNNLKELYKSIPTLDKTIFFAGFIAMISFILFTTENVEPLPILLGVLVFAVIAHFAVTKTYSTSTLILLVFQAIIIFPVSTLFAFANGENLSTDGSVLISVSLSLIAVVGISYIAAWGVWRYSSGRYWVKLGIAYFILDFVMTFVAVTVDISFTMILVITCTLIFLAVFPWKRLMKTKSIDNDLTAMLDRKDVTESVKKLVETVEGTQILPSDGKVVNFIVKKGKTTFHVSVLGLNRDLKITTNSIFYGNDNLKPYLYQTAIDTKNYSRRNKNSIPVIVNYADESSSFIEIDSSLKAEEKRVAMPVIITTPLRLVQLIKEA